MRDVFMIFPASPTLSMVVWASLAIVVLYLGRIPAHLVIRSLFHTLYSGLRMMSRSVSDMASRMAQRNREVLIAAGRDAAERRLEREFLRLDSAVKRDLGNYPALHREVLEKMNQLESDYRESTEEQPPNVEGWEKAISAVAKIPSKSSTIVAEVLDDINDSFTNTHKEVIKEYRRVNKRRHTSLGKMIPTIRSLNRSMEEVDSNIKDLAARAREVGKYMDDFKEIRLQTDKAEDRLQSSALFQFFISGLILAIAIAGAIINFQLIETPMREMVNNSYIGDFRTSNVAALVIIMVEISMGLFLMELLRITRLFPGVSSIDDRMRRRLIWIAFTILFTLACVESALAFMRELIVEGKQATRQILSDTNTSGVTTGINQYTQIGTIGQMSLGFILPFALVFVAIPLESFVQSALTGIRTLGVILLRLVSFLLRIAGSIIKNTGRILVRFYDLIIIVPLWVETMITGKYRDPGKGKVGVI